MTNARMMTDFRAASPYHALIQKTTQEKPKCWILYEHLVTDNQIKRPNVTKTFTYKSLFIHVFASAGKGKKVLSILINLSFIHAFIHPTSSNQLHTTTFKWRKYWNPWFTSSDITQIYSENYWTINSIVQKHNDL